MEEIIKSLIWLNKQTHCSDEFEKQTTTRSCHYRNLETNAAFSGSLTNLLKYQEQSNLPIQIKVRRVDIGKVSISRMTSLILKNYNGLSNGNKNIVYQNLKINRSNPANWIALTIMWRDCNLRYNDCGDSLQKVIPQLRGLDIYSRTLVTSLLKYHSDFDVCFVSDGNPVHSTHQIPVLQNHHVQIVKYSISKSFHRSIYLNAISFRSIGCSDLYWIEQRTSLY